MILSNPFPPCIYFPLLYNIPLPRTFSMCASFYLICLLSIANLRKNFFSLLPPSSGNRIPPPRCSRMFYGRFVGTPLIFGAFFTRRTRSFSPLLLHRSSQSSTFLIRWFTGSVQTSSPATVLLPSPKKVQNARDSRSPFGMRLFFLVKSTAVFTPPGRYVCPFFLLPVPPLLHSFN